METVVYTLYRQACCNNMNEIIMVLWNSVHNCDFEFLVVRLAWWQP